MARKLPGRAIQAGSISATQLDNTVTTVISQGGGPKITNIQVTDNTYTVLDDTAVDTAGGYIRITGTGFAAGCQVLINNVPATSTTFVSATQVRAQVPATAAGTYVIYLVNTDGGVAIRVNGITFSATPTWVTGGALSGANNVAISIQLSATLATTYALAAGSTLPTGLTLTSGGLLSGTITGLTQETVYSFTVVATDSENQDSPRTFTLTIIVADPYYELVTLHLPGNGTNGAQNNTFLDSSANNFTITRNGNTTQGTFSPFSQTGWGNYFNGSNYLQTPSSTSFAFGTGDFTVEGWFFSNDTTVGARLFYFSDNADNVGINYNSTGTIAYYNGSTNAVSGTTPFVRNQWNHVAVVRSSGTVTIYVNGTSAVTQSTPYNSSTARTISIPTTSFGGGIIGYISNIRIVKGVAVYTGNFTPPTSPLTATQSAGLVGSNIQAITGTQTSLLTCQSNRFVDNSVANSGTGFTITPNGSPSVQAFSPFNPSASWSAAAYGGSGYFDGSGDYIQSPTDAAFQIGTGDYTLECWAYITASLPSTFAPLVDLRRVSPNYVAPCLEISNSYKLQLRDGSTGTNPLVGSTTLSLNSWHHLAITRQSGTTRCFVNGVLDGTVTNTTNFNSTVGFTCGTSGDGVSGGYYFPGYVSNVRVVKGTAVYTGAFTPPTAPLTAITNTSLLLNFTNAGIYDATSKNDLETVGDAQISTTQSKWGGSSMAFDGTGDYLATLTGTFLNLSGDFTIEGWVYLNSSSANVGFFSNGDFPSTAQVATDVGSGAPALFISNGSGWAVNISSTQPISILTWTHVAYVCSGSTFKIFVNGVQGASATYSGTRTTPSSTSVLGRLYVSTNNYYLNGYIQDFRITRGYARYTSNFTPPTSAFQTL